MADLDFDGNQDILVVTGDEGITWFRNEGSGTFVKKPQTYLPFLPTFFFHSDFADLDNDGDLDLVTELPWYNQIVWFENTLLATDIQDYHSILTMNVFPNPFSNHTTIEVEGLPQGNYQLQLMDILGRKLKELDLENGKVDLERGDLVSGVYLFRILTDENRVLGSGKVMVE